MINSEEANTHSYNYKWQTVYLVFYFTLAQAPCYIDRLYN